MASIYLPPSPKGHFLFGILPEYNRDPLGFSLRCARKYGDVVLLHFGPFQFYMFNHFSLIEEVLYKQSRCFIKSLDYRVLRGVFGDGLLLSEGSHWQRHRRLMQPAFHKQRIAAYGKVITTYVDQMLTTWQTEETRDIHQEMMQLTLKIIAKTLFGADIDKQTQDVGEALETIMAHYLRQSQTLFLIPEWLPTPDNRRSQKAVERLNEIVFGIISTRRQTPTDDLLSMLLQATDEDGSQLTDQELRDEVMTLLLAGHETTANALSWTLMLLSQHPEVEVKLVQELQTVLDERLPTVADLAQLRYTGMVVKESMRLYPPAWGISREVIQECKIGGYRLRPGKNVYVSQWVMHRDPRFFENPEAFYPERWTDGLEYRLSRCTYFPFGDGPRVCVGKGLAMLEAVLILAAIAQKFRLTLVPEHPIEFQPSITLRPKHGIKMLLTKR